MFVRYWIERPGGVGVGVGGEGTKDFSKQLLKETKLSLRIQGGDKKKNIR